MITIENVTRAYGDFTAVDDVSFTAEPGRVTGFLGPNGAGKSTTMRIIVGLTRATSGTATVAGRSYLDLPNPGLEVGVLLDASAQHAGRTGREILTIAQRFMGLPRSRVEEMLSLVSLTPAEASRRVRDYSLGMRQRLGIATALIGEPEVLILDEPANGLDPAGIRWMRGLLRDYADHGGTVLLSSHLLHEIEVVADDLVVIGNGRIVAAGAKADLLRSAGSVLRTGNRELVALALLEAGITSTPVGTDGLLAQAGTAHVGTVAFAAGVPVIELKAADGAGLEEMFLELTAETQRDSTDHTHPQGAANRPSTHPDGPHRQHRAAQDVRHPVRVLAAGQHRNPGVHRHGGGDRVFHRRRPDLQHVRDCGRLPDDRDPAHHRHPVGDQ
jgi:ABC-2 type transport system ATP-binding protein